MATLRVPLALLVLALILGAGCITSSSAPSGTAPAPDATQTGPAGTASVQAGQPTLGFSSVPSEYGGIKFTGNVDTACALQTAHALQLLDTKDHEDFLLISRRIGIIDCRDDWSGMYAWENPPRFRVGNATRNAGTYWYAGAIAHDSCHSRQYHDYANIHPGGNVPEEIFSGEKAETECIGYQYSVLEKIGAPQKMLDYVKNSSHLRHWEIKDVWW